MSFVSLSHNFSFVGELYILIFLLQHKHNLLGQKQKAEEKKAGILFHCSFKVTPTDSQANESYSLIQESPHIQCFWKAVYEVVYRMLKVSHPLYNCCASCSDYCRSNKNSSLKFSNEMSRKIPKKDSWF